MPPRGPGAPSHPAPAFCSRLLPRPVRELRARRRISGRVSTPGSSPVADSTLHRRSDEEEDGRPDASADLSAHEEKKADEEQSLSADITHEVIRREGEEELKRSTSALAWSGFAAG